MEVISAARIIECDLAPGSAPSVTKTVGPSSRIELVNLLSRYLPRRFAQAWCDLYGASRPLKQYNGKELQEIAVTFTGSSLRRPERKVSEKAEVTVGGVLYRRPLVTNNGSQARFRALLYRRSGGCDGPTGWLQLSVGLGLGFRRRSGCVIELSNSLRSAFATPRQPEGLQRK